MATLKHHGRNSFALRMYSSAMAFLTLASMTAKAWRAHSSADSGVSMTRNVQPTAQNLGELVFVPARIPHGRGAM